MRSICVIGAGIVGTSVAYHLSTSPDNRVTIVDAGSPGAATTSAGTGLVSARGTVDPVYRAFKAQAIDEYRRLATDVPSVPWISSAGMIQTEDSVEDFHQMVEQSVADGIPVETMSASRVNAELEPHISFNRPDLEVAYFPQEFTIVGADLAQGLFRAAIGLGAIAHLGARVMGIDPQPQGQHKVAFEDGTFVVADAVVNAAGAQADQVAKMYGVDLPMAPQPGITVTAATDGNVPSHTVWTSDLVIKPEGDGVIRLRSLLGWNTKVGVAAPDGGFTGGLDRQEFVHRVLDQANRLLPMSNVSGIATRFGTRPIPADGLPCVGEFEAVPGFYSAVTHSGGVLAPFIGRILASEISTGRPDPLLCDYRPGRFSGPPSASTRTQGLVHDVSAGRR